MSSMVDALRSYLPTVRVDREKLDPTINALKGFMADLSPGYGDVRAAERGSERFNAMIESLRQGEYLQGASQGAEGLTEHLSTVPVLGDVATMAKGASNVIGPALVVATRSASPRLRTLEDVRAPWKKSGVELDAYTSKSQPDVVTLSRIVVLKGERGKGVGTAAVRDLIDYANDSQKTIALTPSKDFGATSVPRLKKFYKNLGFVENKGANKDFTISESMYRLPDK